MPRARRAGTTTRRPRSMPSGIAVPASTSSAAAAGEDLDAVLLIGDAALRSSRVTGWEVRDLGTEWTRWTGLPFVYAFWMCRGGTCPVSLTERLEEAKRVGLARIDDIVESLDLPGSIGLDAAACRDYLRRTIQFDLGPEQLDGLAFFYGLLEQHGLVAAAPASLRFVAEGATEGAR